MSDIVSEFLKRVGYKTIADYLTKNLIPELQKLRKETDSTFFLGIKKAEELVEMLSIVLYADYRGSVIWSPITTSFSSTHYFTRNCCKHSKKEQKIETEDGDKTFCSVCGALWTIDWKHRLAYVK